MPCRFDKFIQLIVFPDRLAMNLRQLEVFVAVVESGSFSRAAESVLLTQSTISQHVAALERELGFRLLDRTGHGVALTEGGRLFLLHTRRVLAECTALRQGMAEFLGLEKARLTIGASNVPANYLIPRLLPALAARHPGITLSMLVGDSREVSVRLLAGELELAVTGSRVEVDGVEYVPLAVDTLLLVVGSGHPWRERAGIALDDLAGAAMIVRETGSGSGAAVTRALQSAGFDPGRLQVAACLGSDEAVKQAVAGGCGAAFLSSLSVMRELALGELVKIEVAGLAIERHFWLAMRRGCSTLPRRRRLLPGCWRSNARGWSGTAVHGQVPPGLIDRHDLEGVDIDVPWQAGHQPDQFGDILGPQWLGAGVDLGGAARIPLEAHAGELGFGHPRGEAGGPDPGAEQVGAQVAGKLLDEGLACAVDVAAGVGPASQPSSRC